MHKDHLFDIQIWNDLVLGKPAWYLKISSSGVPLGQLGPLTFGGVFESLRATIERIVIRER